MELIEEDIESLIKKLETADTSEVDKIISVLIQIGESAVGPLINALSKDLSMFISKGYSGPTTIYDLYFAEALAGIGQPSVKPLIDSLPESTRAYLALGKIGGEEAFQALFKELKSGNWMRVEAAAKALGEIGDARALDALKVIYTNTTSAEISWAAEKAISTIERKQIGESEWLKVDRHDPYAQVNRVWDFREEIVYSRDSTLLKTAIEWHSELVKAMPGLSFVSDRDRGFTWVRLGFLIIYFRNRTFQDITADAISDCEEAKYCFQQCLTYFSDQDISDVASNAVQEYLEKQRRGTSLKKW